MSLQYILIVVTIILIIVIAWCISISNKLNRVIIKIEESDSGIDVALAKRYEVITKMIEVVKAYTKHEKEILFEIISLRKGMSLNEKKRENIKMNNNIEKINIAVENYPELKSNENYKLLQQSIIDIEEHLQAARRLYNSNVSIYNQMLVTFPTMIIANLKGLVKKEYFEVDDSQRQNIKIDL